MKNLASLATAALIAACAQSAAGPAAAEPVKARVETGVLVGEATERAKVFRNVPFAAPPTGALRWAPPQPAAAWDGERPATGNGPSCVQKMNADGTPNLGAANGPVSEDCLQLNIFAPKTAEKAPVMVWIHGGGNTVGAGWVYDGQNFARDGVVLVSVNYRLGPFGWFAHPALTAAAGDGEPLVNYGLMDQIAALQWVKRNIAAFGGDPDNVTIFGESAGGMNALALLATPSAQGLFHKAVVQSGGGWFEPSTLADREAMGVKDAAAAGLPGAQATAAQLRALPAETVLQAFSSEAGAAADGRLLAMSPTQALARGAEHDVPLIIGWNNGEDSLLGPPGRGRIFPVPAAARAIYPEAAAAGDEALGRAVFTDRVFGAPARWVAAQAADGAPAWLYHFTYVGSRFRAMGLKTAAHAAEIQYVFEYWGRRTPEAMIKEDDRAIANLMHGCWVAFARTGAPECGIDWPAYDPAAPRLVEFGSESGVRENFAGPRLDAVERATLPSLGLD